MAQIVRPFDTSFPIRLEVGSGVNPYPGYVHLDAIPGMPELNILCDMQVEKIPVADQSCAEVLANHVIEHVSWRGVGKMVKEWARVLIPGGVLNLRTPDLEFICRSYLEGKTTPEWPEDEHAMKLVFGQVGPAEWANIKILSGQDNEYNFHKVCFDFGMMKSLLERNGFKDIQRATWEKKHSPGELQVTAVRS